MPKNIETPILSEELIDYLDTLFPEKCADLTGLSYHHRSFAHFHSLRRHGYAQGHCEIARSARGDIGGPLCVTK